MRLGQMETPNNFSDATKADIVAALTNFPQTLDRAIADWTKFKLGKQAGLFADDPASTEQIIAWFRDFPQFWQLLAPNYDQKTGTAAIDAELGYVKRKANDFVARLTGDPVYIAGLGIAPLVIAGVIIAGILGLAGVTWAIGYVKKQYNISSIIDQTVAGKIPADILNKAIQEDAGSSSPFGDIADILKWGLIGFGIVLLLPYLKPALDSILGKKGSE